MHKERIVRACVATRVDEIRSRRIYRGRKKPRSPWIRIKAEIHERCQRRPILVKRFTLKSALSSPGGATARKVFPAFSLFQNPPRGHPERREEKWRGGERGGALNCKFDPDRSCALATPTLDTIVPNHVELEPRPDPRSFFTILLPGVVSIGEINRRTGEPLIYGLEEGARREEGATDVR